MVTEGEENEMKSECEEGRLTKLMTCCLGMGPSKSKKNWVMRNWKYMPNRWGRKLGYVKWWVMSDE